MENSNHIKLLALIKTMNIPEYRKSNTTVENIRWIHKYLGVRNKEHAKYREAMELTVTILRGLNMLSKKDEKMIASTNAK